ncbi:MAG: ABC transporter permease [Candidatus Hydrogenedentota bacterium]
MSATETPIPRPAGRTRFTWGRVKRTLNLGLKSLWLHRLRSLLTVLGIVFGVCSVIAMLAVGEGASYEAQQQIRRLGSKNIILRSVKPAARQSTGGSQSQRVLEYGLTYRDVAIIEETVPGVREVVPARLIRREARAGTQVAESEIYGTTPRYLAVQQVPISRGRFFTPVELEGNRNVCVIEEEIASRFLLFDSPLGQALRLGGDYYTVVGLYKAGNSNSDSAPGSAAAAAGDSGTTRIYIPLTAAKNRFGEILIRRTSGSFEAERVQLHEAIVHIENQENVEPAAAGIQDLLSHRHKEKDYEVIVPLELLRQAERTKRIFNIVLGAIAAISLLVGGIGIMNIMLASVTERTREIGIRRALGARRRDIIIQFLVETVMLSAMGGIIGVALGLMIPYFITTFAEMRTIVTPAAPILAFTISAIVGVVFGLYPAIRAAHMDPVEALRHD